MLKNTLLMQYVCVIDSVTPLCLHFVKSEKSVLLWLTFDPHFLFQAQMMVTARHRLETMPHLVSSAAPDDNDSEVEAIMVSPLADARASSQGKDRETRIPRRVFRTASTRTPGAFMGGNGEGGEAFCKGDVLCLGNSSRKRYNGSQWRSLCSYHDGCDRESQRGGRCSMHSKHDPVSNKPHTAGEFICLCCDWVCLASFVNASRDVYQLLKTWLSFSIFVPTVKLRMYSMVVLCCYSRFMPWCMSCSLLE